MSEGCPRVLLVDDDELFCLAIQDLLGHDGVEVVVASSLAQARAQDLGSFGVVILDDQLPDGRGLELFPMLGSQRVVAISADPQIEMAIAALRHHAVDFLDKPVDPERLRRSVHGLGPRPKAGAHSRAMLEFNCQLLGFAPTDAPVLLRGETGTGKTRAARWLHEHSERAHGPFVAVNCGALPENLIESELFGVERGAFTGARESRQGLLEAASGGTFFLDEIGELPFACQAKLLDAVEDRSLRRVGGTERRTIDVRFISATHVDLEREVEGGRFRRDLLYRLDVLSAELPPLRARLDGFQSLIAELLAELGCHRRLGEGELLRLRGHDWPGNIRELRNVLYRAMVLQRTGVLEPSRLLARAPAKVPRYCAVSDPGLLPRVRERAPLEEVALRHIIDIVDTSPTRKDAAETLGIGESTLRRKLKQARQFGLR